MTKKHTDFLRTDRDIQRFDDQTGKLEQESEAALNNDTLIQDTITKVSELSALTVSQVQSRSLHPSIWIISVVTALIAVLYLIF
ncbi:MAG: hypothetical protein ACRYGA_00340 [Janthinobacterium lividum]